jgi:hypothetical protein
MNWAAVTLHRILSNRTAAHQLSAERVDSSPCEVSLVGGGAADFLPDQRLMGGSSGDQFNVACSACAQGSYSQRYLAVATCGILASMRAFART